MPIRPLLVVLLGWGRACDVWGANVDFGTSHVPAMKNAVDGCTR